MQLTGNSGHHKPSSYSVNEVPDTIHLYDKKIHNNFRNFHNFSFREPGYNPQLHWFCTPCACYFSHPCIKHRMCRIHSKFLQNFSPA